LRFLPFFAKTYVNMIFLQKLAAVWSKNGNNFAKTFQRKYFKDGLRSPCLRATCVRPQLLKNAFFWESNFLGHNLLTAPRNVEWAPLFQFGENKLFPQPR
jgi:hypothetical protein